jgi:hypothetical protein
LAYVVIRLFFSILWGVLRKYRDGFRKSDTLTLPLSFISLFLKSPSKPYVFILLSLSIHIHQHGGNKERGRKCCPEKDWIFDIVFALFFILMVH